VDTNARVRAFVKPDVARDPRVSWREVGEEDRFSRLSSKHNCQNGASSDASACGAAVPLVRLPSKRSC
jgi:hypothetical protein